MSEPQHHRHVAAACVSPFDWQQFLRPFTSRGGTPLLYSAVDVDRGGPELPVASSSSSSSSGRAPAVTAATSMAQITAAVMSNLKAILQQTLMHFQVRHLAFRRPMMMSLQKLHNPCLLLLSKVKLLKVM